MEKIQIINLLREAANSLPEESSFGTSNVADIQANLFLADNLAGTYACDDDYPDLEETNFEDLRYLLDQYENGDNSAFSDYV